MPDVDTKIHNALLTAVTEATAVLLDKQDWTQACRCLLQAALTQTSSEYGFAGVVMEDGSLRFLAIEGKNRNEPEYQAFYENAQQTIEQQGYLEFHQFDNLFGHIISSGEAVISNAPIDDGRAAISSPSTFPLSNFMGLPIYKAEMLVGIMAIANCKNDYQQAEQNKIAVLAQHAGVICDSYRQHQYKTGLEIERKKTESALKESRELYRLIFEHAFVGFIVLETVVDDAGKPVDWICREYNQAASDVLNIPFEQVEGRRLLEIFPAMEGGPAHDAFHVVASTGKSLQNIRYFPLLKKYMEAACHSAPDNRLLVIFRDVSKQIDAEETRQRSIRQLESLMEISNSAEENTDERIRQLLRSGAQTLHVERVSAWRMVDNGRAIVCEAQYYLSSNIYQAGARFDETEFPEYFKHLRSGRPIDAHDLLNDPRTMEFAEAYRPLKISSMLDVPIRIHGQLVGVVCHEHVGDKRTWQIDEQEYASSIANQVALTMLRREQLAAEQALKLSEERLDIAVKSSRDWIWDWDLITNALYWSPSLTAYLGHPSEFEPDWTLLKQVVHPKDWSRLQAALKSHLESEAESGTEFDIEFRLMRGDGSYVWLQVRGQAHRNHDGKTIRISGSIRDITERKQAEHEKEQLIAELEARNAELEQFTYTVSHDLKSPLITIQGFLGFLEHDIMMNRHEKIEQDIARIRRATQTMGQLLDDLLELSRTGRLVNPSCIIDITALAKEAVSLVEGSISQRRATVEIKGKLPDAFGDPPRLREVFQNLVENAVKFMGDQPLPHIEIGARHNEEPVIYYVRDNGVGIPLEYHDKVFNLFERLKTGETEGTGIGLALVKRIIEVHSGRIWVESDGPGHGSTFCFTLPATPISA